MRDVTHSNMRCGVAMMSRLLKKKKVSFAKYSHFDRALLQKRPMYVEGLLIVATSYPAFGVKYGMWHDNCIQMRVQHGSLHSFVCNH